MLSSRPNVCRRGITIPAVALLLTGLLGVTALAVDGGLLLADRRRAQAAADAAALAAAIDLYQNWTSHKGKDTNGTANTSAKATATDNGFTNGVNGAGVAISIPPSSGPYKGLYGYAEVVITMPQARRFSTIFGSGDLAVKARAVARGLNAASDIGILLLNPTAQGSLTITGSATMKVVGRVIVDSSHTKAAVASGSAGLDSTELDITGNYNSSSSVGFISPTIKTGQAPTPDFLADLPVPNPLSMTVRSSANYKATSGQTLQPGLYVGGITISSQPNVTLAPGIYYLQGGGFTMSGGSSSLIAKGVMIYNGASLSGSTGKITLSGGGAVTMSPLTDGDYAGMAIFQDRTSTQTVTLSGGSNWNFTGTVYAAKAHVDVSGGSGATMGSQYISDTLTLSGSSTFNDIDPAQGKVERLIGLVE